jgi:hypothetical protein
MAEVTQMNWPECVASCVIVLIAIAPAMILIWRGDR